MTKDSGFSDVRVERQLQPAPVYTGSILPPATVDVVVRVRARCNDCGSQLNAYRANESATPGTFFGLIGGNIQITCGQCEQQWIFNQAEYA